MSIFTFSSLMENMLIIFMTKTILNAMSAHYIQSLIVVYNIDIFRGRLFQKISSLFSIFLSTGKLNVENNIGYD